MLSARTKKSFTILCYCHETNNALADRLPDWIKLYQNSRLPRLTYSPLHSLIYSFNEHLWSVCSVPSTSPLVCWEYKAEGTCSCSQSSRAGSRWAGLQWEQGGMPSAGSLLAQTDPVPIVPVGNTWLPMRPFKVCLKHLGLVSFYPVHVRARSVSKIFLANPCIINTSRFTNDSTFLAVIIVVNRPPRSPGQSHLDIQGAD